MALVLNDRVKETTTTTGTGTINLAGAETGFETFVAGIGNSNTCYYTIAHQSANEFEVGLGTVTDASPDTLSRTTIISSSNSDSAVNFSSGIKDVFCTLPASKAVFVDSSGNVGIGTSSPGKNLEVNDSSVPTIRFARSNSFYWDVGHTSSQFQFNSQTGGTIMQLNYDGNVGIGTTSPSYILDVSGGSGTMARITSGGSSTYLAIANTSNTGYIGIDGTNMAFYPTGTKRGNLDSSGNFIVSGNVTAYGSPSDIRLKENIEVIDNAVDKVKQLKGITYTLKSDGNKLTGLIAQDLEKVLPEAVYTSETLVDEREGEESEEHLAIRYGNTVGLLVEAIKELEARVKELEDK